MVFSEVLPLWSVFKQTHERKLDDGDLCAPSCPLWFMLLFLFTHTNPSFQFAGGSQQADARSLQFEVRVLQRVIALVGLIAGIVQVMQSRAPGIGSSLRGVEVGLCDLVLEIDDLLQCGELRDRALQLQSLFRYLVLGCLNILLGMQRSCVGSLGQRWWGANEQPR